MAEGFRKGESRRDDIVEAARQLYEERGLSRTTVRAIAERVGVTRTLFYHYFADKDAVTSAVLDDYVADYLEALRLWNESRRPGDIERALESVVKLLRLGVFEHDAFRLSLASKENAELYLEFLDRVADRTASSIVSTTVRDYDAAHGVRIDHVHETFYILIVGMVSFVRRHPEAGDEVLKDLIAQTLHMERGDARPSGGG